jgi:hypothetical protein
MSHTTLARQLLGKQTNSRRVILEEIGERRCTAKNRQGERCKNYPMVGGFVCKDHGGRLPQTQAEMRRRLMSFVDPALSKLEELLEPSGLPCAHCGRTDDRQIILGAVKLILDRALPASARLKVKMPGSGLRKASMTELKEELGRIAGLLEAAPSDVVDAELVPLPESATQEERAARAAAESAAADAELVAARQELEAAEAALAALKEAQR